MYSRYSTSWMSRFLGIGLTPINPHPLVKKPGWLQIGQRGWGHPVFLLSGGHLLAHSACLVLEGADGYLVEVPIVAVHSFRATVEDIKFDLCGGCLFDQLLNAGMKHRQVGDFVSRYLVHQIACPFDIAVQVVPGVHSFILVVVVLGVDVG